MTPKDDEKEPAVRVVDRRWWARGETSEAAAESAASLKPTYVQDLEQRLEETTTQLQAALADQRRSFDEFEQVRTRLRRDTAREVERGRRATLVELLDVVDNLERAIAAGGSRGPGGIDNGGEPAGLLRGVTLVRDQFLAKLATFGVQRLPAVGEPFDATRHEAVTTTPVDDPAHDGHVIAVIKDGYAIGDDILRPASVVVGKSA
jgi:molecular chaperone GrpE